MSKRENTMNEAYELALNRRIGGLMPYSLNESSRRVGKLRKAKKRTKAAKRRKNETN